MAASQKTTCDDPSFAGDADPGETDDEQDLREHEVADAQLFPEHRAVRFDGGFGLRERGGGRGRAGHAPNMDPASPDRKSVTLRVPRYLRATWQYCRHCRQYCHRLALRHRGPSAS